MRLAIALICYFLFSPLAQAAEIGLPSGWRILTLSDLKWTVDDPDRTPQKDYLSVRADFDGDGKKDAARFLVKKDGSEYALFISHYSDGKLIHYKHYSASQIRKIANLGISLAKPGVYKTACAKGYGDECRADEPKEIRLEYHGIYFFTFESAASIVYWQSKNNRFEKVFISD